MNSRKSSQPAFSNDTFYTRRIFVKSKTWYYCQCICQCFFRTVFIIRFCSEKSKALLAQQRKEHQRLPRILPAEHPEKSGSLNTAAHALEQGKEVFAVPGNITNPYSQGCNKLIRQGANPYTEPDDLLRVLFPEKYLKKRTKSTQALLFGDTEEETAILLALSKGLRNGEEIMQALHLSASDFNQIVTLLEIKGQIRSLGANNWSLS